MEYPFNDEIFDHDNDEIFQNNQLETDSLWCSSLIDISEYDNQFFHEDTNFDEVLNNSSQYTQSQEIHQFPFEIDEENNTVLNLELSPLHMKSESIFKPHNKSHMRNPSKPYGVHSLKDTKSELFFIENLTQPKQSNLVIESHTSKGDFIGSSDDLEALSTRFLLHQKNGENSNNSNSNNNHDNSNGSKKNVFYFNQFNPANRRHKPPTIFLAKRNSVVTAGRKPISKICRQDNTPIYSVYQDTGSRNQSNRMKYSLSPSTSSPDSVMDCSLSGNAFQQQFSDEISSYTKHNDIPNKFYEMKYKVEKSSRDGLFSSKISNASRLFQSPIPQTGLLILTEEEKRTLLLENYAIPTRLPLTKQEERNLKKVRRKIKNKISAQESRRKKKEYMEALEKKVEIYAHENNDLKKRLDNQESLNKSLLGQLRHLQQMLGRASSNTASTCLMVFLLCFSLILVGMPDRLQTMRPPQSVLVVSNIHKLGYGSIGNIQRTEMTAMQRYFPPDINGLLENTPHHMLSLVNNESHFVKTANKGNQPVDDIFSVNNAFIANQRKGILLENTKEEDEDCVQYGPRYLWWFLQSTNMNVNVDRSLLTESVSNDMSENPIEDNGDMMAEMLLTHNNIVIGNLSHMSADKISPNETYDQFKLGYLGIST